MKRRSVLMGILQQRCPRCREGRIFQHTLKMNDPCPHCGMIFEREPGYFLGAMYFSYALGVIFLVPLYYLTRWLFPGLHSLAAPLVAFLPFLFLVPALFRSSRVLWMYFDRAITPSELSDHQGWKRWRESQRAEPPKQTGLDGEDRP